MVRDTYKKYTQNLNTQVDNTPDEFEVEVYMNPVPAPAPQAPTTRIPPRSHANRPRIDEDTKVILRQPVTCQCGLELISVPIKYRVLSHTGTGEYIIDGNVWFNCKCGSTHTTSVKNIENVEVLVW